jgi:hypothetical protein
MRDPGLDHRRRQRLWVRFAGEVQAAGLYERGGWAPRDPHGGDRYLDFGEWGDDDPDEGDEYEE